jgi:hypothetical protein
LAGIVQLLLEPHLFITVLDKAHGGKRANLR